MNPRMVRALLIVVVVLLGADYAVWHEVTGRMQARWQRWQSDVGTQGWTVAANIKRAGWPLAARLVLDRAAIAEPGGFGLTAAHVTASISVSDPGTLVVAADGPVRLTAPGRAPLDLTVRTLRVRRPLSGAPRANASVASMVVTTAAGPITIDAATLSAQWAGNTLQGAVSAGPIDVPAADDIGFGPRITAVTMDFVAQGAWRGGRPETAAQAFRASGGRIAPLRAAVTWGKLDASVTGTLDLDENLQPDGNATVTVADPDSVLAALAASGTIAQGTATAASALIDLVTLPQRLTGGQPHVPLRLQHDTLLLGKMPLLAVPPIKWK